MSFDAYESRIFMISGRFPRFCFLGKEHLSIMYIVVIQPFR